MTKSGAEGGSMRGQRADWIYLDETDYLSDGDIYAISSIAIERPDIGIWASSTPTGKRGKFYSWCMDAQGGKLYVPPGKYKGEIYTEFYYPSTVLPTWDEKVEKEWRMNLSEEAWEHEVMANFGQETIGVFNKMFIDRAKRSYEYIQKPTYSATRIMGIDWDKYQATPQIVVLEYDPTLKNSNGNKGMFKVINRATVPRSEFTLDNAVEKVIELNGVYRPAFVYVDRGFGEYQIEILKKRGLEAKENGLSDPAFGLDTKVVGVAFNEHLPVRDPASGIVEKKPLKPFMVNQAVLLLERDKLVISEADSMVWRQMENYQVVKLSVDGRPTYTSENEHALDALMLAVLGFALEFPNITQTMYATEVTRTMAIAPPIKSPEPSFNSQFKKNKEEETEVFLTRGARERASQQWFRVDDLRKNNKNIIRPRGKGNKTKAFKRPMF